MSYLRKIPVIGIAFLLALVISVFLGSWVISAAVPENSGTTRIALSTRELNQGNSASMSVSARLTDANQPLGNEPVEFDLAANFFGDRAVNLGTVVTDATGTASIIYEPRWEGTHVITARFKGDGKYATTEVTQAITFSGPVYQYQPESAGLTAVREWTTPLVISGLVIFWIFLLFVVIRTLRGISLVRRQLKTNAQHESYNRFDAVVYQKRSSRN
jgi:hypothetical protein